MTRYSRTEEMKEMFYLTTHSIHFIYHCQTSQSTCLYRLLVDLLSGAVHRSEWVGKLLCRFLTCTVRASCYSTRLSLAHIPVIKWVICLRLVVSS